MLPDYTIGGKGKYSCSALCDTRNLSKCADKSATVPAVKSASPDALPVLDSASFAGAERHLYNITPTTDDGKLMNSVLGDYINKFALVYLDDIVVYSKSADKHEARLC